MNLRWKRERESYLATEKMLKRDRERGICGVMILKRGDISVKHYSAGRKRAAGSECKSAVVIFCDLPET